MTVRELIDLLAVGNHRLHQRPRPSSDLTAHGSSLFICRSVL